MSKKVCKAEGCERTDIKGYGYCTLHWSRLRRNGSLEPKILKNGPRMKYPEEYRSWESMKERCSAPNHRHYKNYGGRGIKVCDRWLEKPYGFSNFIADMGPKPSYERTEAGSRPIWTLDRIDIDGDYTPENCRWANILTQMQNRSNSAEFPGIRKQCRLWVVSHRTKQVTIRASFSDKEAAIAAKKEWNKKYPSK